MGRQSSLICVSAPHAWGCNVISSSIDSTRDYPPHTRGDVTRVGHVGPIQPAKSQPKRQPPTSARPIRQTKSQPKRQPPTSDRPIQSAKAQPKRPASPFGCVCLSRRRRRPCSPIAKIRPPSNRVPRPWQHLPRSEDEPAAAALDRTRAEERAGHGVPCPPTSPRRPNGTSLKKRLDNGFRQPVRLGAQWANDIGGALLPGCNRSCTMCPKKTLRNGFARDRLR